MIENATNLTSAINLENPIDISIVSGVIIAIVVVITLILTLFHYRNKRISKIIDIFASDEMRKGMMRLRRFEQDNPNFIKDFIEMWRDRDPKADEISLDSGRYFHHFLNNVFKNRNKGNNRFVKHVININHVTFLLEIVDPIEKTKAKLLNTQYNENIAKECKRIFKDEL